MMAIPIGKKNKIKFTLWVALSVTCIMFNAMPKEEWTARMLYPNPNIVLVLPENGRQICSYSKYVLTKHCLHVTTLEFEALKKRISRNASHLQLNNV